MAAAAAAGAHWKEGKTPAGQPVGNVDVAVQRALVRLSKDPATAWAAYELFDAIVDRTLRGIFAEGQRTAAARAAQLGRGWWEVIPRGEDVVLLLDPAAPVGGVPLVMFGASIRNDPGRLDAALVKAARAFRAASQPGVRACAAPTTAGGDVAAPAAAAPLLNIFPPVLCWVAPRGVPVVVSGTLDPVTWPGLVEVGLCIEWVRALFDWAPATSEPLVLHFPADAEAGVWTVGFMQDVLAERLEVVYPISGTKRYAITNARPDYLKGNRFGRYTGEFEPEGVPRWTNPAKVTKPQGEALSVSFTSPKGREPSPLGYRDAPMMRLQREPLREGEPRAMITSATSVLRFKTYLVATAPSAVRHVLGETEPYTLRAELGWRTVTAGGRSTERLEATRSTFSVRRQGADAVVDASNPIVFRRGGRLIAPDGPPANEESTKRLVATGAGCPMRERRRAPRGRRRRRRRGG